MVAAVLFAEIGVMIHAPFHYYVLVAFYGFFKVVAFCFEIYKAGGNEDGDKY